jgi:hypothetical protein
MQAVYRDKCVDVSTADVVCGSLGKQWGKPLLFGERKDFFKGGIQKLVERWQKCIGAGENYMEKRLCTFVYKDYG